MFVTRGDIGGCGLIIATIYLFSACYVPGTGGRGFMYIIAFHLHDSYSRYRYYYSHLT